ncbi:MAG: AbrB/MazE/SpoVT family DNA-binding domain-containing protein [Clostridia bacterium]|nr:AbrB/MazE/SpoVT family DNA-binding domain-containing protein [Clostridia bacterium]
MKATGIVREVDALGRFVIPKEIRKTLGIDTFSALEIYTEGDTIILRKYAPACIFCNELDDMTTYEGKLMCKRCINKIASLAQDQN